MKEVISQVCYLYGLIVHYVESGDKFCQADGEENYLDHSYFAGNEIYLGIYKNEEFKFISFFHEVGHILLPSWFGEKFKYNTLIIELECWHIAIMEAQKLDVFFSDEAIEWGYKQALSYVGHDKRERS